MTVWRVGMLAVCVDATPNPKARSCSLVEKRIYRVSGIGEILPNRLFGEGLSLFVVGAESYNGNGFSEGRFRPLIDQADDTALIARIKNCTPQRVVAHE